MMRWTKAVALAATAAALVVAPTGAGAQEEGDGLLPPGHWSEEQRQTLLDLIDRTEAALPAFADPAELLEMGFIDFGVTAPGGYDHFINWDWIDDDRILDPTKPESLVFHVTWDETGERHHELVSAMFFLPSQYGLDDMPEEYAWYPGWHTHEDICVADDHTFAGLTSNGQCSVGRVFDKPPMMHTWITDNPCSHRFGGIDVGGLHCDVHGHPDPDEPPTTHPPGTHPPGTHPPGTHPPGTHPPGTHPPGTHPPGTHPPGTHPPADDGHGDHVPVPATPIHQHPDHAG